MIDCFYFEKRYNLVCLIKESPGIDFIVLGVIIYKWKLYPII